jgi:hypothetical protein
MQLVAPRLRSRWALPGTEDLYDKHQDEYAALSTHYLTPGRLTSRAMSNAGRPDLQSNSPSSYLPSPTGLQIDWETMSNLSRFGGDAHGATVSVRTFNHTLC